MSLSLQLSIREKMNAEFPAASSLPMFIQFLSSSFTGFILCSQRLFDISAERLEDIFQGFPLVYRIVHSLSHQFVCHEFSILHHHDHLMMDTFKNRSRKLKSFFLICSPLSFIVRNKSSFLNISPIGSIISIAVLSDGKASTHSLLQCVQHPI